MALARPRWAPARYGRALVGREFGFAQRDQELVGELDAIGDSSGTGDVTTIEVAGERSVSELRVVNARDVVQL